MSERQKRNVIIISLCGVLLLMVVGYAAFATQLNINGTTSITSNWDIKITDIKQNTQEGAATDEGSQVVDDLTATFKVNLVSPGDYITYDVTIENKGTIDAELNKIILPQLNNEAILITTSGLTAGDELLADHSATLTVKIEYNPEVTKQPENKTASFEMKLDYVQKNKSEAPAQTVIDMKGIEVPIVTEEDSLEDGLYNDPVEPGRYVYKGTNPNNYITFNGEVAGWRIISIETDGTIKIVKNDSLGTRIFDPVGARITGYCSIPQAPEAGCGVWAKIDYYESATLLWVKGSVDDDSELKTYLNTTYYETIKTNREAIQNHKFYFGSIVYRETSLLTMVNNEKKYGAVSNVGLIQGSDYVKSNTNTGQCSSPDLIYNNYILCRTTNWLYHPNIVYWTLQSRPDNTSNILVVYSNGGFSHAGASNDKINGLYPVIYLKPDIELSGTGTGGDPFTIENY